MNRDVYIFTDIHNNIGKPLIEDLLVNKLLKKNEFSGLVIFLGDFVDRGDNALQTIYKLHEFVTYGEEQFIMIEGNHDSYLFDYINTLDVPHRWSILGGDDTIEQLSPDGYIECINEIQTIKEHSVFSYKMIIEGQRVLFTHSGIATDCWATLKQTLQHKVDADYSIIGHWSIYDVEAPPILSRKGTFSYETCPETANPYVLITLPTHKIIMIDNGDYNSYVNISEIIRSVEGTISQ